MAVAVVAPRQVRRVAAARPEPEGGQVLVRVEGCGVCGSSLPVWEGRPWFSYPLEPGEPGHEAWGRTDDGTRVSFLTTHGYAEWAAVEERTLVELPRELDARPFPGEALACAVNVVRRAKIEPRHSVAVVGMGFLGTAVSQLLGERVTQVRRDTAVDGEFDRVIECAGTQSALDTASRLVARGGTLVIAGFHQDGPRTIDLQSWNWRGIDVVNAHEREEAVVVDAMREAAWLAAEGHLDVAALVTHTFPLAALDRAFEAARTRPAGFVKAVVLT